MTSTEAASRAGGGNGWQRTMRGSSRRPSRRIAVWAVVAAGLMFLSGVVAVGVTVVRIEHVPVEGLASPQGAVNILVVGSDSRDELTPEQRVELTTGRSGGNRTDTIFIMSISGSRVAILALPRDLWVTRCNGSKGRINAAFAIGGPSCLVATVSNLTGISISNYMAIDFLGFVDLVNAVGGVQLCLDRAIKDKSAGIDLPEGCQVLDGADALGFVRVRKIDSDLERIKRQQAFLRALAGRAVSVGTVINPIRLMSTGAAVGGAITADKGFGLVDLFRLANAARGLGARALRGFTVPVRGTTIDGASVLLPRDAEAETLFAFFRDGSVHGLPDPEPTPSE